MYGWLTANGSDQKAHAHCMFQRARSLQEEWVPTQAGFWLGWEIPDEAPRDTLLQGVQRIGERVLLRFAEPVEFPTQAKSGIEWATGGLE